MSIIALIPARSDSKRIKNKNIKILNNHPLIAYTISAAIQSNVFNNVVVSTNSKKYKQIAEYYGANVLLRPEKYAGDNSPDIEWITYTLNMLSERGEKYDYFSILRPTSPFRMPETIERAVEEFLDLKNVDSIRAVEVCSQHPAKMWFAKKELMEPIMVGNNNGVAWHSCQFNSLPVIYIQNASLEIARTNIVFKKKSISGDNIMPFFTKGYEGFDLNQPFDWEYAAYLVRNKMVHLPTLNTLPFKTK